MFKIIAGTCAGTLVLMMVWLKGYGDGWESHRQYQQECWEKDQ